MKALRPVSIHGLGAVTAAGAGVDALFAALLAARPLAATPWRYGTAGQKSTRAATLALATWAASERRFPGRDAAVRLALTAIDEAAAGRSLPPGTGLFVGTSLGCVSSWEPWHRRLVEGDDPGPPPPGTGHGDLAFALAAELGLAGPVVTVSTACTSSAAALIMAADALRLGEIEHALVVGADVLSPFVHAGFAVLGALSPDDRPPAPFTTERGGFWPGEGAAAVVLSLDPGGQALYLGGGTAGDAVHMTAPDREAGGLVRAVERALAEAGLGPGDIDWVSAHATGTRFNDAMEATGLRAIFGESMPPVHGAKPVIGHTLGAAALLEVVAAVEAMRRGVRPPTHAPGAPDPELPLIPLDTAPVVAPVRRILSLNSAFAGHNTAVILGAP